MIVQITELELVKAANEELGKQLRQATKKRNEMEKKYCELRSGTVETLKAQLAEARKLAEQYLNWWMNEVPGDRPVLPWRKE